MGNGNMPGMPGLPPGVGVMPMPMPQPMAIDVDTTGDFMLETMVMLVRSILKAEQRKMLIGRVVSNMEEGIKRNMTRLRDDPRLSSARIDGSLDAMETELTARVRHMGNIFIGEEFFAMPKPEAAEEAEQASNGQQAEAPAEDKKDFGPATSPGGIVIA